MKWKLDFNKTRISKLIKKMIKVGNLRKTREKAIPDEGRCLRRNANVAPTSVRPTAKAQLSIF